MAKVPATQTREPVRKIDQFKAQIRAALPTVAKMLPKHIHMDEFESRVIVAVANKPELLECESASLLRACAEAAELGVSLNPQLGEAWILKVYNKKLNGGSGGYEAQLRLGYIGIMKLARQSGEIKQIIANVRYKNDPWKATLVPQHLEHSAADGDRGEIMGAYCWWMLNDGTEHYEYMPYDELMAVKERTSSKNHQTGEVFGPWKTDEKEMLRKTPIRRARKYMPQSPQMQKFHDIVTRDAEKDFEEAPTFEGQYTDVTDGAAPPAPSAAAQTARLEDKIAPAASDSLPLQEGFDGSPDYALWTKQAIAALTALAPSKRAEWRKKHADVISELPEEMASKVGAV